MAVYRRVCEVCLRSSGRGQHQASVEETSMYLLALGFLLCPPQHPLGIEIPSHVYHLKKHVMLPLAPVPSVPEKGECTPHNIKEEGRHHK